MSQQSDATVDGTPEYGAVAVRDNGVEVIEAPEYTEMTFELVFGGLERRACRYHDGLVFFGSTLGGKVAAYKITGVSEDGRKLQMRRWA